MSLDPDQDELKKKLTRRVGAAIAMILVLLGGLAALDELMKSPPPPARSAATPAAQAPHDIDAASPAIQAEEAEIAAAAPEPERTATPHAPLPLAGASSQASQTSIPDPLAGPSSAASPRPDRATESAAGAGASPGKAVPLRRYVLQAGVFHDVANAVALHAKLTQAGIASRIESRVRAGPFPSRQEAEAARVRLHGMGVEAVLVMTSGE